MGIWKRLWSRAFKERQSGAVVRMAQNVQDSYYAWNGKIYESDIVRACITPYVKAVGKLLATHVRQTITESGQKDTKINPDTYMRFLLEEPNPWMSGQKLQERMAADLKLNRNAFALIVRDSNGLPSQLYPIACTAAEAIYKDGRLYIRFTLVSGDLYTFPYSDLIHLADDVRCDSVFGSPIFPALAPLMEVVTTTDQGVVHAIKNSSVVRWLLKFVTSTREEDIEKATKRFADSFLNVENGTGVAGVDAQADAIQIHPDTYTPSDGQLSATTARIYALMNTNPAIVTSSWTESQWAAYFEAEIEPTLISMQNEWTRKLFTRRERGFGNRIVFDAGGIDSETTATKLAYVSMVNRRAMTPNEWREKFHMSPVPGGDELIFWQDPGNVKGGE